MGTFLNLVGAVRTLLFSIALVAVTVSVLSVFNTLLAALLKRTNELSVMRAIGASRAQIVGLITTEALLLTGAGSITGIVLACRAVALAKAGARDHNRNRFPCFVLSVDCAEFLYYKNPVGPKGSAAVMEIPLIIVVAIVSFNFPCIPRLKIIR